jgi:hypothetical protein
MERLKDLSAQITKALDGILPEEVRCVFVLFDPQEKEVSTASNMSDDATLGLLEEAVEVLKQPEVEEDLTIN